MAAINTAMQTFPFSTLTEPIQRYASTPSSGTVQLIKQIHVLGREPLGKRLVLGKLETSILSLSLMGLQAIPIQSLCQ
jgi:hypothetical protein